jgi:hypothetical protein
VPAQMHAAVQIFFDTEVASLGFDH